MATLSIVLKTTHKLANEEFAVALRVTHDRQSKYFAISQLVTNQSLKFRCTKSQWKPAEAEDNGLGRFRKSYDHYKECNSILDAILSKGLKILKGYESDSSEFTIMRFELDFLQKPELINKQKSTLLLVDYYESHIKTLENQQRIGLAGLYKENQSILKKFNALALITDVNVRFLEGLEYWLRNERKNKDTSISVKMRNLQRVINQAIEDKLMRQENYPFGERKYSVNKRLDHSTKKLAIHTEKVGKLTDLILKPGSSVHFAQQICLFSYYCRGMNFIDICELKWENISHTHIEYVRKKTRGKFVIPLNQYNHPILEYFKSTYVENHGFVFPIINPLVHITPKQRYTRKKTALKAVNDNLKKLAIMIGEPNLKLSTNVLRHSYATGLKRSGAQTSHITEALGHSTEFQTQTYLAEFEAGVIESIELNLFNL